jgi:hypothetical protein
LTSGRRPVIKIIAESLSQHDEKHVVPTPISGIRVEGRLMIACHVSPKYQIPPIKFMLFVKAAIIQNLLKKIYKFAQPGVLLKITLQSLTMFHEDT